MIKFYCKTAQIPGDYSFSRYFITKKIYIKVENSYLIYRHNLLYVLYFEKEKGDECYKITTGKL